MDIKSFFIELLSYNNKYNQQVFSILRDKSDQISNRLIMVSSHVVNAHAIWNDRIIRGEKQLDPWAPYTAAELCPLDDKNFKASLSLLDEVNLESTIQYSLRSGKVCVNTVRDILFQIINHSTYHRGQIATEFRQCGIDPLLTDWIVYKMS